MQQQVRLNTTMAASSTHLWLICAVQVCELSSSQEAAIMVQHSINASIPDGLGTDVLSIIS